jgi:hypothetical protein
MSMRPSVPSVSTPVAALALVGSALVCLTASQTREPGRLGPQPLGDAPAAVTLSGQVTSTAEGPMEGVVVTAKREGSTIAVSVMTDADGRYRFPADRLQAGPHALSIRAVGYELDGPRAAHLGAPGTTAVDLTLRAALDMETQLTNAEWLESIPGTEDQKRCSSRACAATPSIESCGRDTTPMRGCRYWNGWMAM